MAISDERKEFLDNIVYALNYNKVVKDGGYIGIVYLIKNILSDKSLNEDEKEFVAQLVIDKLKSRMELYYDGVYKCYINSGIGARLMGLCSILESCDNVRDIVDCLDRQLDSIGSNTEFKRQPNKELVENTLYSIGQNIIEASSLMDIIIHINCVGLDSEETSSLNFYTYHNDEDIFIASININNNISNKDIEQDIVRQYGKIIGIANYSDIYNITSIDNFVHIEDTERMLNIVGSLFLYYYCKSDTVKQELNSLFGASTEMIIAQFNNIILKL